MGRQAAVLSVSPHQINWILLISRQGKVRLAKWFTTMSPKAKGKITKDVTQLVLARRVCGHAVRRRLNCVRFP